MNNFKTKSKNLLFGSGIMTLKDYLIVLVLTIIFSVLVFFRLGNCYAPQSFYETSVQNRDIIIDFGSYVNVSKLSVYLGNLDRRHIALSAFNEVTSEWEIINSDLTVDSVFQWNDIYIYYNLRYLGIVSLDEDGAVFNEFVFTDSEGNVLTPLNTNEYPALFDEQDMFPKTLEASYMDGTMFDEVYHGRTGYEFVHGLTTYETTHPMLGKCFIALGIKLFGMTPFGWRFFSAIFGILTIPLMYFFAKRLFKNTYAASCVGIFISFDCMHYTLSRIATIDMISAYFIIAAYYFMFIYIEKDYAFFKKTYYDRAFLPKEIYGPLAMSGIFMGLAIATKLTGVYAAFGLMIIMIIHLIRKWPKGIAFKLFWFCFLFFIVLPLVCYTLAYIPVVEEYANSGITDKSIEWTENGIYIAYGWDGLLAKTVRNTNYMINYHKNLVAEHYYASPFYEWPFVWRPLFVSNAYIDGTGTVSAVSYIGNVAIWWMAFPIVLYYIFSSLLKIIRNLFCKKKSVMEYSDIMVPGFLIIGYLAMYLPWFLVSRITFIYHYLPAILFNILLMGYAVKRISIKQPKAIKFINIYLIIVIVIFFLFFPLISGLPVAKSYGEMLRFLPEWVLVS